MTLSRRAVLAGAGAATLLPRAAWAEGDAAVRVALDEAQRAAPAVGLTRLAGVTARGLPAQLDLEAARAGLAIDATLAARFPPRDEQRTALTRLREAGTPGATRLANGNEWYALQLRRALGDGVTPEAAEQRLDAERRAIEARALPLFAALGIVRGTTGERYSALWRDERFLYPDSDAGRDRAVADMRATLAAMRARVPAQVGPVPAACLGVEVRALNADEIAAGKGGYRVPPSPGHAGIYIVDLKDIRRRPSWTLPSVVAHELLPGHMIQLPLEALAAPHPLRLEYAPAFAEGWGIYAETLAAEGGAFADPRAMLGHLHWLLFRVGRGLVDLGVHRHGWTLAQARARLDEWQGEPAYFAPFDPDLQRLAIEPAIRVAEAMVWLTLADRTRHLPVARRQAFRRAVLLPGRRRVEQLIALR